MLKAGGERVFLRRLNCIEMMFFEAKNGVVGTIVGTEVGTKTCF